MCLAQKSTWESFTELRLEKMSRCYLGREVKRENILGRGKEECTKGRVVGAEVIEARRSQIK